MDGVEWSSMSIPRRSQLLGVKRGDYTRMKARDRVKEGPTIGRNRQLGEGGRKGKGA
jgi:hypothetical protein